MLKSIFKEYFYLLLTISLILVSFFSFIFLYSDNKHYLGLMDSIPRLNLSRKIIDNLTPGIGQLGAVWLPLPILLMLPFIWNNFLWHSGIAGSIISTLFFIFGGLYLYKLLYLLFKNNLTALTGVLLFASNINILFFQTSPMSELIYITCIIAILYYVLIWFETPNLINLFKLAFFQILITLTRYEGYAILLISIGIIILLSYRIQQLKQKNNYCESTSILFIVMSSYGLLLWTLYLWIIFKDPIIWLKIYFFHTNSIVSVHGLSKNIFNSTAKPVSNLNQNYFSVFKNYFLSSIFINGIITSILGYIGILTLSLNKLRLKHISIQLVIPLVYLIFFSMMMILGKFAPTIDLHNLSTQTFLHKNFSYISGVNMRFGLSLLPFIIIFYLYLFSKNKILRIIALLVVLVQLNINIFSNYSLFYELPRQFPYIVDKNALAFKKMYNGGLILASDNSNQYFIFASGLDYKNFIHEGTQNYWKESLLNPTKYATWIIFDTNNNQDSVSNYLHNINSLSKYYNLIYKNNGFMIYKIKSNLQMHV